VLGQRASCERDHDSSRPGQQQREDDAAAEDEEEDGRGGEDRVLPGLGERLSKRDPDPEDGADGGRSCAVEEGPGVLVATDAIEALTAEEDHGEGGSEGDECGEEAAADPCGGVADDATVWTTGPGVTWPSATALRNSASVVQW
jgi:hypothetical protein